MLESAIQYLQEHVAPRANVMDGDSAALAEGLKGLAERGLLALKRPPAVSETEFRTFQEEVARASGALAFLQTQHQSAVGMIARSDNEALKARLLPDAHNGGTLIGIGFSQLRRPGPPMVTATPVPEGYLLNGHVPWVTGEQFFPQFLIGATLPDGRSLFGVAPLRETAEIKLSPPMRLAAMEAARTVTADFTGHLLKSEDVVDIKPSDWIMRTDMINITLQGFFAIGCARAGVDVIRGNGLKRQKQFLIEAADLLDVEISECRTRLQTAQTQCEETTEEKLNLRAWAIALAGRSAHAAVAASGGAANSVDHPAQRILRESLVFAVSAQTEAIQRATMRQWTKNGQKL